MAIRTPEEIGEMFKQRRLELDLNQDEMPGVSTATVRKIEKGTEPNPTDRVRANLARALSWEQNAYEVIRLGGRPNDTRHTKKSHEAFRVATADALATMTPEDQRALDDIEGWLATLSPDDRDRVQRYVVIMGRAIMEGLKPKWIADLVDATVQLAEQRQSIDPRVQIVRTDERFALAADKGQKRKPAKRIGKGAKPTQAPAGQDDTG